MTLNPIAILILAFTLISGQAFAAAPESVIPTEGKLNSHCPISGKPVNPEITWTYEGLTFAFAQEACRTQFKDARENSLYHKLGGKAAINAAVEAFYVKVLSDNRVKHYFDDINMKKQRRKQKEFLSAAFGGPIPWQGKDMRRAHANLPGLNETHFNAIAENLQTTLEDLKVNPALIHQVMTLAGSLKGEVLNEPKPVVIKDLAATIPAEGKLNTLCPISGKPVNPEIKMKYEGLTYAFAEKACRAEFRKARRNSLYQKLGAKAAIDAAVEAFYVKVLADKRVKHYFDDINMKKQRRKQKEFLSAAFGGPTPWLGKDMRRAHKNLPGLNETHFNAIAENLQSTLDDLKINPELIQQVMTLAGSLKGEVLNHPKKGH